MVYACTSKAWGDFRGWLQPVNSNWEYEACQAKG